MEKLAQRAYQLLKTVPPGRVTTYKILAEALGTKAYRAVGQAMKRNPDAPIIPCHRVLRNDGSLGGFMGKRDQDAVSQKKLLLESEGHKFVANVIVDFEQVVYKFES